MQDLEASKHQSITAEVAEGAEEHRGET